MLTNLGVKGHKKCHRVAMKIIMANSAPFHRNMPSSDIVTLHSVVMAPRKGVWGGLIIMLLDSCMHCI